MVMHQSDVNSFGIRAPGIRNRWAVGSAKNPAWGRAEFRLGFFARAQQVSHLESAVDGSAACVARAPGPSGSSIKV